MSVKEVLVDAKTIKVTVPSATAIAIGDLLFNNAGVAAKFSAQADAGTEALNQALAASLFLGVSADQRLSTETGTASRVAKADGVFDVTCPSTTWAIGELVGPSENAGGDGLENQQVEKVANPAHAIGYCVQAGTSVTTVRCRLISRYVPGAVRAIYGQGAGDADGDIIAPVVPMAAQQALSGAGAINVTAFYTAWTTTGANAGTLANGTHIGQLKRIQQIVDGGDGTLTPASLSGGTTITFADAGDFALLMWNGTAWVAIQLGNDADGATAPVLA